MQQKGFTIIELIVSVAIITVLSLVILFSINQYVTRAKDSNVSGNLAVLIPAGEAYYNVENGANSDGYFGFCASTAVTNASAQLALPNPPTVCSDGTHPGLCCSVALDNSSWGSCAQEFTNPALAFCVDSRGVKRDICTTSCSADLTQCPSDNTNSCAAP